MDFVALMHQLNRPLDLYIVSFDPGETTGVAVLHGNQLLLADHLGTGLMEHAPKVVNAFLMEHIPHNPHIVCEDYKIYGWKANDHSWASLHTPRLIGCIETLCSLHGLSLRKRMAQDAKNFCTDDRLRGWNFYTTKRHARDAIRHAVYYALFDKGVKSVQST